jgi:hypothetical protein
MKLYSGPEGFHGIQDTAIGREKENVEATESLEGLDCVRVVCRVVVGDQDNVLEVVALHADEVLQECEHSQGVGAIGDLVQDLKGVTTDGSNNSHAGISLRLLWESDWSLVRAPSLVEGEPAVDGRLVHPPDNLLLHVDLDELLAVRVLLFLELGCLLRLIDVANVDPPVRDLGPSVNGPQAGKPHVVPPGLAVLHALLHVHDPLSSQCLLGDCPGDLVWSHLQFPLVVYPAIFVPYFSSPTPTLDDCFNLAITQVQCVSNLANLPEPHVGIAQAAVAEDEHALSDEVPELPVLRDELADALAAVVWHQ